MLQYSGMDMPTKYRANVELRELLRAYPAIGFLDIARALRNWELVLATPQPAKKEPTKKGAAAPLSILFLSI